MPYDELEASDYYNSTDVQALVLDAAQLLSSLEEKAKQEFERKRIATIPIANNDISCVVTASHDLASGEGTLEALLSLNGQKHALQHRFFLRTSNGNDTECTALRDIIAKHIANSVLDAPLRTLANDLRISTDWKH